MTIKKPIDCSQEELELFKSLVLLGGQVDPNGLKERIANCKLLGFHYNDKKELVGVSALKSKSPNSVKAVQSKAEISESLNPQFELGYSVTKKEFRGQGINKAINDKLLDEISGEKVYATTDNDTMRHYLIEKGFTKKGKSFKGKYNENLDYFEK